MRKRFTGLWKNAEFVKLWAAETVSGFGSIVGRTALPFAAILVLKATPLQMALLAGADRAAGLVVGLAAGVWVDRLRLRPILIGTDLGRAALLATIPAAAALHVLRIEQLYVVAFLTGILTMFFDVAYVAYLPSLVRREELLEGNSKLAAGGSVAEVGGFGLAGWLVQLFGAPIAVLLDAFSFLFSAALVGSIHAPEPPPAPAAERQSMRRETAEGVQAVLGDPLLRAIGGCAVTLDFFFGVVGTVYLLYATRELGFRPGALGMIFAVGGVTSFLGALVARRVSDRLGVGMAMVVGLLLSGLGTLLVTLAHGATITAALLLIANQLVTDPAHTVYEINQVSLRQGITPDRLLGRANASIRFLGLGAMLVGSLMGGVLGQTIGLRPTLAVGACGVLLAAGWLVFSPVRGLKGVPEPAAENAELPREMALEAS